MSSELEKAKQAVVDRRAELASSRASRAAVRETLPAHAQTLRDAQECERAWAHETLLRKTALEHADQALIEIVLEQAEGSSDAEA